ncbi:hypothetical protein SAMN04487820_11155 [Actinopolyspora mzabensis]|uniref:Uncharacterized protein n=1 Tax=Actinopolyspora mzabensis TaxID=995066 RepID=A0A1G9E0Z2_ACTMZ|nr:hypothetical protein [Actinopolyspora mzabensis]SDK69779.1 hypothetical protein SAMN04487820_11155 [Actinopolyspora mzabensis]
MLWALPITAVALVGAVAAGLFARNVYGDVAQRAEPVPESSAAPTPEGDPPGTGRVALSEGARRHPDAETVQQLLQEHFDAINENKYYQWRNTVVRAKRINQPFEQWQQEYRTTEDGTVVIHRIVPGPEATMRVIMTFVSTQDPADAPKSMPAECLRWRVVYRIVPTSEGLRLGQGLPDSSLPRRCAEN